MNDHEKEYVDYHLMHWNSDWNGDEVGFPHVDVVGLYEDEAGVMYYVDTESGEVLEKWESEDDE